MKPAYAKRAFTLIELLVVISIIALLLGILMPALTKAKDAARAVMCQSNLKQWSFAVSAFGADHKDKFPDSNGNLSTLPPPDGWRGNGQWWIQSMRPYYQDPEIRHCANVSGHWNAVDVFGQGGMSIAGGWDVRKHWVASYDESTFGGKEDPVIVKGRRGITGTVGVNAWLTDVSVIKPFYYNNDQQTINKYYWGTLTNVKTPERVPLVGDSFWVDGWPMDTDFPQNDQFEVASWRIDSYQMQRFCVVRHGKCFVNWVFLDGHSEKVTLKQLWGLRWNKAFRTSNVYTQNKAKWRWLDKFPN